MIKALLHAVLCAGVPLCCAAGAAESPAPETETDAVLALAERPFETVSELLVWLEDLEAELQRLHDDRAIFVSLYVISTAAFLDRLGTGYFEDDAWMTTYTLNFGSLYRTAFLNDECGRQEELPEAWRVAFAATRDEEVSTILHVLLGIHAHVNHDLPLALARTGVDGDRALRWRDHYAPNALFVDALEVMETKLAETYDPVIGFLDAALGHLDETLGGIVLRFWRGRAWTVATTWTDAPSDERRRFIEGLLDAGTGAQARLFAGAEYGD